MKSLKNILIGIVIFFVSGIISYYAFTLLFKTIDTLNPAVPERENLKDSILQQSEMAKMHRDSAAFYDEAASESFAKFVAVMSSDTADRAALRANYRSNLRAKIRAGSAGYSDSLRATQTGGLKPAKIP
ncbi:hypothetical protein [Dyadobacter diqingensis]|uniref:hypothetical protein n=1 Tax=Dyadobacter diqingensis TaxID=2938121 RepID=UPI0020C3269F|nr:hypothetical protein [Dyadobacter diqingensis]